MTRAQFIKNLGLFGTLLTVLGYKQALSIKGNDKVNVTNTTIFDLEFFSDRYGKKHNCEKLVNQINDYFRSNKKPNFEQIVESGKCFHDKFIHTNRLVAKIGRGTSNLSNKEQIDEIEDFISLSILNGKCRLLLGDSKSVSNCFHQAKHLFICMSKLNIGKKGNLYPKGLCDRFYALVNKEMAETYLKTDFMHTDAIYYYHAIFQPNEMCSNNKNAVKFISKKELRRIKIVLNELQLRPYLFHNDTIISQIKNNISKYNSIMKPYVRKK
jgi:hypothetical protein